MGASSEDFVLIIVLIGIAIIGIWFLQMIFGLFFINPMMALAIIAFIVVIAGCAILGNS